MKYNNTIDFFSSPNSRFIGLSDIRYPQYDHQLHAQNNNHIQPSQQIHFIQNQQDKKWIRKLSFNSNLLQPIMPFGQDFFQQKLQQCDQPEEQQQLHINHHHHHQQELDNIQNDILAQNDYRTPITNPKIQPQHLSKQSFIKNKLKQVRLQNYKIIPSQTISIYQQKNSYQSKQPKINQFNTNNNIQKSQFSIILPKQQFSFATPKRKSQFFTSRKFCQTTAQKGVSRNNQKGLRRLSSLAYAIVSQSTATTYKQVAQKLLTHLNFTCTDMEDQDGPQKSSMQNIKRRVYDSLNVLLALGVIKRIGSKIAKQKQRKSFSTGASPQLERYNQLLDQYNLRLKTLQTKKKTQRQLKQKLLVFKRTVQRNRRSKIITKNKLIRLPFLAFLGNQDGKVDWLKKEITESVEKKKVVKRQKQLQKEKQNKEFDVKITFRDYPESYGDLDFFKLLQTQSLPQLIEPILMNSQIKQMKAQARNELCNKIEIEQQQQFEYRLVVNEYIQPNNNNELINNNNECQNNEQMMNLIDSVFQNQ